LHEFLDLALHFFHALAHLKDDRHTADVHAQIAGQRENEFQPLQIFVSVEAGVALGAGRLEQALAFVQAQGLGWIPYISATAEIMYAPLDFRFVIGPEPTITNLQQNKAATDRHGFARIKKDPRSCVPIRGRWLLLGSAKWPSKVHFCVFRQECKPKINLRSNTQLRSGRAAVTKACSKHSRPLQLGEKSYITFMSQGGIRLLDLGDVAIAEIQKATAQKRGV